jgi:anti-sigma B factor antagonist/stage II sporulation protein AA (anti-sigma F factor antagonist)
MSLDLQQETKGAVLVFRMKGRLDVESSPDAEKKIAEAIDQEKISKVLIDMAGVDYLSSAGMRLLLATTKKVKLLAGGLVCVNVQDPVMDVLHMSGFDHVLILANSEEEGLAKFS